ncbi:MAG TPA: hypothetical protein VKB26_01880 [Candidatus Acidoferrales bacterium]|nr:hypothetical protein [Candidatus Acidoferrales bacterium]
MRLSDSLLRVVLLLGVLAVFSANLCTQPTFANDKDKELKAQAEALLAKSRDLSNIEAPGSPAFVLNATIHYQAGQKSFDGEGHILWAAPDHFRQKYVAPGYMYDEVARDGSVYRARTNDQMPLVIYKLRKTFAAAMQGFQVGPKDKPSKVEPVQSGGQTLTCITVKSIHGTSEGCLDADGNVVTIDEEPSYSPPALGSHYEFSRFASLGTKKFPQELIFRGGDGDSLTIDVRQLALATDIPPAVFDRPLHSAVEPWCASPKFTDKPRMPNARWTYMSNFGNSDFADAVNQLSKANAILYCVINPAGHVQAASVLRSSLPIADGDLQAWMQSAEFGVMQCGGGSVEYEIEISF